MASWYSSTSSEWHWNARGNFRAKAFKSGTLAPAVAKSKSVQRSLVNSIFGFVYFEEIQM
jgi:hypothetical protein